ncbi:MAG: hypothetical protein M3198_05975 [Actinomycetota bacterium]|nr:hypothetical protein [Actinomycetota bacterium]
MARAERNLKARIIGALPHAGRQKLYDAKDVYLWLRQRRAGSAPPSVKQRTVKSYGRRFGLRTLVETGTFQGAMVAAALHSFDRIYSIELDRALAEAAKERFEGADHVSILQGDSTHMLPQVLYGLREPALFWLDAHYSGGTTARGEVETPILAEISAILEHPVEAHVILVDDAREFDGFGDYPSIETLCTHVTRLKARAAVQVRNDIIRIHTRDERR